MIFSNPLRQFFFVSGSLSIYAVVVFFLLSTPLSFTFAQSQTDNYQIPLETPASGGGEESKSNNYILEDTIGQPGIGDSKSTNYDLDAGYRQANEEFFSLSCDFDTSLGNLNGVGQRTGTLTCTVITDSEGGYSLGWRVDTGSGGMSTGYMINQFENRIYPYDPSVDDVPETWTVPADDSRWGGRLSSTSDDTDAEWGTDGVSEKWLNVGTGSTRTIVERTSRTDIDGSTELVEFRAEVGSSKVQPPGTYEVIVDIVLSER